MTEECGYCNVWIQDPECTKFDTTIRYFGYAEDDPVIEVTLPWGEVKPFQQFDTSTWEKKTYYEPGNETNYRSVQYVGTTGTHKPVFKICKLLPPKFGIDFVIAVASAISGGVVMWGISLLKK